MNEVFRHMKAERGRAQKVEAELADKLRREGIKLKMGDRVWINACNITTQRPSKMLDWKRLGPYPVTEVISKLAYRLQLPRDLQFHPVQLIS
jgi:hypothetical protein